MGEAHATKRPRALVAIDGPAGVGKSTVARRLADALGFVLVDTGALYRAVALAASERGVSAEDGPALGELATSLRLSFRPVPGAAPALWMDGTDRSADLRSHEVSALASQVSQHPAVRQALLSQQRQQGEAGGAVLEGRDIGTVVFPDADIKFFLTASAEVRATRRFEELRGRGEQASVEDIAAALRERDQRDSQRAVAPLRKAADAVEIDTGGRTIEQVVDTLLKAMRERGLAPA